MAWLLETGNHSAAYGAKYSRVQVVSAYPITPQTTVIERLSRFVDEGELDARFIRVESEHSALAAAIGASQAGARAFTATSSHGLAYMHEMIHWAANSRAPIVMINVNRSLAPPWSIWTDYIDSISQRDTGWLQFYAASNQEIFDTVVQAYKVAENRGVSLPIMVNYEGFSLSLTSMPVQVPEQQEVDDFLPPYQSPLDVDFDNPKTFGSLALPEHYDQFKVDIVKGMENAKSIIDEVREEYRERFGRDHGDMLDVRKNDGNRLAVVTMGAVACEAEEALNRLDGVAEEVDLIRIRTFRPFPGAELKKQLSSADAVLVLDRSISPGAIPPLYSEVMSSIRGLDAKTYGAIVGIGGRDITYHDVESLIDRSLRLETEGVEQDLVWWRNGS